MRRFVRLLIAAYLGASFVLAQEPEEVPKGTESTAPVVEGPREVSLAEFEQLALQNNPTLAQAAAQVQISRGKAIQAGLYPNPTVRYVADQVGVNGTAGELQGGFVQQEIVTGGKLRISRAKYQQEVQQAQAQFEAQEFRVLSTVRGAFYKTLATQRQAEVRTELARNAEEALKTTRGLLNVGQANRPDVLQAEVQVQRMRAAARAAERRSSGHWQELTAVVGMPQLEVAPLSGKLEISEAEIIDRDEALANLLNCSPQFQVAWAEIRKDQIAVQRELVEPIPNFNVRAETGKNYDTNNTVLGLTVGIKLPIYDRNQGSIMQARAELSRAQAEIGRIEMMLRKKFGETFAEYDADLATARSFEKEILPKAREAYESYLDSYQKRRAAWPQVLVAQREYFQLSDEYLETLLELRTAEAEIKGLFLGSGLDQPPAPNPGGHRDATPRPR